MALNKHTNILSLLIELIIYILYNFSIMTVPQHGTEYGNCVIKLTNGEILTCKRAFSHLTILCFFDIHDCPTSIDFSEIAILFR